jgi:Viral (Superfamily 1) RNA helicase/Nuclease-related domain
MLLIPNQGVVVIEVKAGLHTADSRGRWRDGDARITRNPWDQVTISRHQLERFLSLYGINVNILPLVAFVGMSKRQLASLPIDAVCALTREQLLTLSETIVSRLKQYITTRDSSGNSDVSQVATLLRPGYATLMPLEIESSQIESVIAGKTRRVVRLTDRQAEAIAMLGGTNTGTIVGSAGTGKTLIAVERATQLAKSGHAVVFALGAGLLLEQRLASEFRRREVQVEVVRGDAAVSRLARSLPRVDAVIFDEFQQFSIRQLRTIGLATSQIPLIYIFGDPDQTGRRNLRRLYHEMTTTELYMGGRNFIQLSDNCRNAAPVATIASAFATFKPVATEVPGPPPLICGAEHKAARASLVVNIVDHLRREGFALSDVAVLAMETDELATVREALDEAQISYRALLACCHYREFIGLEAQAVVIVDPRRAAARLPRALVTSGRLGRYAAATRARVMLAYVTYPEVAEYLTRNPNILSSNEIADWHP